VPPPLAYAGSDASVPSARALMTPKAAVRLENFDMVASFGLGGGAARAACSPNSGPGRSNQWTLVVGRWS